MSKHDLVLCEIIFKDPISRVLKRIHGRISQYEIDHFNENENHFIMPQGDMNSPISKDTITEIIIYGEVDRLPCHKGRLIRNRQFTRNFGASISY